MVARLVTDAMRRCAGVYGLVFIPLTMWLLAGEVAAGFASGKPGAQRFFYLVHLGVITIAMLLSPVAGYTVAFGGLNNRVVQMLPVSRRDIWRAQWVLTTLGAATMTMAAQALPMVIWRATAPAASDAFRQLVVTWLSTFILGGVLLAVALYVPRLPPATGVFRNLLAPVVWFLRNLLATYVWLLLAAALIMAAVRMPGLLLQFLTMDWRDMSGWGSIATALALLVAIASYWHRPRVHARAGRPPQAGSRWAPATLIPRGTLSAIRLLVFENVVSACLAAAVTLGVMTALMTALQSFGEAVAGIAHSFGYRSPIFFGLVLGVAGSFGDRFNARHLRALPVSTLQLTGLLLLPSLLFWLAAITIVSGVHLAVIGTLPRIDASFLALVLGITALCQTLQLLRRPLLRLFALMATIPMLLLPDALAPLMFGILLVAIAIVWGYWLLTRSATPFRADPLTAWTEP